MRAIRLISDIRPWQVSTAFHLGATSWVVHIGVVLLTGTLLALSFEGDIWPYLWAAALVAVCVAMGVMCRRGRLIAVTEEARLQRWGWAHTLLGGTAGALWGLGGLAASTGSFEILTIYSLATGGAGLGAISTQHPILRSAFAAIFSAIPLLALGHVLHDPRAAGPFVALMILLYTGTLSIVAVRMHQVLRANRELAVNLDAKVGELTATTADLERARAAAEDANLAKSRFLAQASHDLRQPIHAIALQVTALKDSPLDTDQRQIVESIDRSVDSVIRLFGSLLDLSRLEVGGVRPRMRPTDLGTVLERLGAQNATLADRNGCELRVLTTREWVVADEALLTTMLQNIISNAVKYAPGAEILLGVRRRNGGLAIEVHDTGPGIPEADREAVFEDYFRVENEGAAVEGMGLGLAIVRRLAELMGWRVELRSTTGRGTAVVLAGLQLTPPGPARVTVASESHPLAGKRIWVVDNDPAVRAATQRVLERWGCIVTAFAAPPASLDACDAVLTDMQDGAEIMVALRAGSSLPIVVLTGHTEPGAAPDLPDDVVVLHKPLRPVELRAAMTRLFA